MRRFSPRRTIPGPGMRHAALEYDLVAAVRPRLLVDLGAGDACSFFACCQSMLDHDVDGSCYAIDTWQDPHGTHADATFDAIQAHGRAYYAGLTYFVRMAPRDARRHFDEGTVDLLRVDGERADVVGQEDVESWVRCLRPGGLVVWHGAVEDPSRFSVVASRAASVVFGEGRGGIGIARKEGPEPTASLLRLLFVEGEGEGLERFYARLHEHLDFARLLAAALAPRP